MRRMQWRSVPSFGAGLVMAVAAVAMGIGLMGAGAERAPAPVGISADEPVPSATPTPAGAPKDEPASAENPAPTTTKSDAKQEKPVRETATFAAGCFWGVQVAFDRMPGVVQTSVGFMGGKVKDVTYEQVCGHKTGHAEVVQVVFDPTKVSYDDLLTAFWHAHDPTTQDRQGPDVGDQYRSAIFYYSDAQQAAAEKSLAAMQASPEFRKVFGDRKIVTQIVPAGPFYTAEEYHQKYFQKQGVAASCHRGW